MMRVCFYSPYIPHSSVGGGEQHLLNLALEFAKCNKVSIAVSTKSDAEVDSATIRTRYEKFLGKSLKDIAFIASPLGTNASVIEKLRWTKQFDMLQYWSDGSLFLSLAAHNSLHVQIPFQNKLSAFGRFKLHNWHTIHANSNFTKKIVATAWKCERIQVLHPKIEIARTGARHKKERIVLSVGRFFRQLHSKKQEVLVAAFQRLCEQSVEIRQNWKLVLVGAAEDQAYVDEIRSLSAGLPVEIHHDISRSELDTLFGMASLYWHAAGYNINAQISPEKLEHFGITTVEAMARGAIPLVLAEGGQVEVLGNDLAELGWHTIDELVEKTDALISNDAKLKTLRESVVRRAESFNADAFSARAQKIWPQAWVNSVPAPDQKISVVIPVYNGIDQLKKHVPSVITHSCRGDQLIFVDDGSTDTSVAWLVSQFNLELMCDQPEETRNSVTLYSGFTQDREILLIAQHVNKRFAQSVNHGVSWAKHPFVLVLNSDVSLTGSVRTALLSRFSDPSVFAVGSAERPSKQAQCISGRNKLWFNRGLFMHSGADSSVSGETAWASGGSAMFSTAKWRVLNGFDPRYYPAYWEDVDLSLRARKHEWKVLFAADALVYHDHETTNLTAFSKGKIERMSWKNAFVFTWAHGTIWQRFQMLMWAIYWFGRINVHKY